MDSLQVSCNVCQGCIALTHIASMTSTDPSDWMANDQVKAQRRQKDATSLSVPELFPAP
jgi:hypothetical protein